MFKNKTTSVEVEVSRTIDNLWRPMFLALVVVAVGFGGYLAFDAYQKNLEKHAQEELFALLKRVEDKKEKMTEADKNPETLQKNYGDILKDYNVFVANQKGRKASYIAAIQIAGLALSYNDLNLGAKYLSQVDSTVKSGDIFFGLIKSQLGSVLMDLKKYQEAAEQYEILATNKSHTYFHPQALLRLGICYLELGDFSKAEDHFTKLLTAHPSTQAANEAKNMKKIVALRKGLDK